MHDYIIKILHWYAVHVIVKPTTLIQNPNHVKIMPNKRRSGKKDFVKKL